MRWSPGSHHFFSLSLLPVLTVRAEGVRIVVAEGDTLSTLAEKYLDEPRDWVEVAKVNRLEDPHLLFPGQELFIPQHLLKGVPAMGKVTFARGEVLIRYFRNSGWEPVSVSQEIPPGSRLRTGVDSALEIVFEDGSACFLMPESSLEVLRARKRGEHHFFRDLFLEVGRIITRLQEALGNESRFHIRTPSATAAARGTEFRVGSDQRRDTRIEVLEGMVGAASRGKQVTLEEGEGTLVRRGGRPMEPQRLLDPPSPEHIEAAYNRMPLEFRFQPVPGAANFLDFPADCGVGLVLVR